MKKVFLISIFILNAIILKAQDQSSLYDSKDLFRSKSDTAKANPIVDVNPQFSGGDQAFLKFINHNLTIPMDIRSEGESHGVVYVAFVVEKDGTLDNFKIEKSYRESADEQALKMIKKSPNWVPGMISGQPCRTNVCLPISFTMLKPVDQ